MTEPQLINALFIANATMSMRLYTIKYLLVRRGSQRRTTIKGLTNFKIDLSSPSKYILKSYKSRKPPACIFVEVEEGLKTNKLLVMAHKLKISYL